MYWLVQFMLGAVGAQYGRSLGLRSTDMETSGAVKGLEM